MFERELRADLCVVGAGMAGICVAIAAARRGVKVILVHDRPVVGGNASKFSQFFPMILILHLRWGECPLGRGLGFRHGRVSGRAFARILRALRGF